MEKTTKKKKKTKSLRRRIGIIAVGGLSLVMTICLSVGATLAWFAGSTWSDENLYMGGPVYVEMAGRGASGATDGNGKTVAKWQGGTGSLDIQASTQRSTGTAYSVREGKYYDALNQEITGSALQYIDRNVLLPGQKFEIYSQARVYSTATTSTIGESYQESTNTGSNVTNKSSTGTYTHQSSNGRITTTTTSVLRARFSISIEFDPSVGFSNFTNENYMMHYPVQSTDYTGDGCTVVDSTPTPQPWEDALTDDGVFGTENSYDASTGVGTTTYTGRRDYVQSTTYTADTDQTALEGIRSGDLKSIYSWKYVSKHTWNAAAETIPTASTVGSANGYVRMGYPFDGHDTASNENGYYGVWIINSAGDGLAESDAFYKERCNAYLQTYVEQFVSEYGNLETKTIGDSLKSLETELNQSFINLVNDSSDDIIAGYTKGFTVNETTGEMEPSNKGSVDPSDQHNASWLYIDPLVGNDTNTDEISTSTGGWWYLVACDGGSVATGTNIVRTAGDSAVYDEALDDGDNDGWTDSNAISESAEGTGGFAAAGDAGTKGFQRADIASDNGLRTYAMLYEVKPDDQQLEMIGKNGGSAANVAKVVSNAFPFVNGTSAIPGDALTNVFANAKISFQISFQALQAFFPYSTSIDKMDYKNPLLGTAKALNIKNAIPIFNEAFDYQETIDVANISGL